MRYSGCMREEQERITELEMRIAHMERTVDELSAELHAANKARDRLATQIDGLRARLLTAFEESDLPTATEEPPPPHY
jgi:SlyX protein